jgi:hypothetical protein
LLGGALGANERINNRGQVAFVASNAVNLGNTVLLSFGTVIGGHSIDGVTDPVALNNRGAVAFLSDSFDGTSSIITSSPNR